MESNLKVCVICSGELATGAKKYCLKCRDKQNAKVRRIAQLKFYDKIKNLDPIRKCSRCGEIKRHYPRFNICVDCFKPKELTKTINKPKKKAQVKAAEDILFLSLINKARLNNHALSNKIRKSTAQESEELWLKKTARR